MKKINSFQINTTDLTVTASSRQYIVNGDLGAEVIMQVFDTPANANDPVDYYNFQSREFSSTFTSESSLNIKTDGESYIDSIDFPANASGNTYTVLLLVPPDKDTMLNFGGNKNSYSTVVTQQPNVTLTFTTSSGTSAAYGTPPTVVSTATPVSTASKKVNWTLTNSETDANGFGFRLARQPIDTDWYFTTTDTVNNRLDNTIEATSNIVNGAVTEESPDITLLNPWYESAGGSIKVGDYVFLTGGGSVTLGTTVAGTLDVDSPNALTLSAGNEIHDEAVLEFITATEKIILDDLTDIVAGMVISAVSGDNAYLIGTPTVTSVDAATDTIYLSSEQAFVDGITLTFQARGTNNIKKVTGADISFSNWNSNVETVPTPDPLTKKIRATGTNAVIALDNTYGLTGGGHTNINGLNVVNTSANTIQSVSADADGTGTDGTITVQVNQTANLAVGTTVTFHGTSTTLDVNNEIIINSHGNNDRTIYLDLDNFITLGTVS